MKPQDNKLLCDNKLGILYLSYTSYCADPGWLSTGMKLIYSNTCIKPMYQDLQSPFSSPAFYDVLYKILSKVAKYFVLFC